MIFHNFSFSSPFFNKVLYCYRLLKIDNLTSATREIFHNFLPPVVTSRFCHRSSRWFVQLTMFSCVLFTGTGAKSNFLKEHCIRSARKCDGIPHCEFELEEGSQTRKGRGKSSGSDESTTVCGENCEKVRDCDPKSKGYKAVSCSVPSPDSAKVMPNG